MTEPLGVRIVGAIFDIAFYGAILLPIAIIFLAVLVWSLGVLFG